MGSVPLRKRLKGAYSPMHHVGIQQRDEILRQQIDLHQALILLYPLPLDYMTYIYFAFKLDSSGFCDGSQNELSP